jgi:hypothetical protein
MKTSFNYALVFHPQTKGTKPISSSQHRHMTLANVVLAVGPERLATRHGSFHLSIVLINQIRC